MKMRIAKFNDFNWLYVPGATPSATKVQKRVHKTTLSYRSWTLLAFSQIDSSPGRSKSSSVHFLIICLRKCLSPAANVRDLIVDRSNLFENLKKLNLWLESEAYMSSWTHEPRYQSARCLMCGCCLEVCPNFSANGTFAGTVAAVNAFRILNEEQESTHLNEISVEYKKKFFEGCGKSLSCHDICPIGLPVEELLVRSNAAAVWGK